MASAPETHLRCVVCGDMRSRLAFFAADWFLAAVPGSFRYVRCATCGTIRADPQLDDAALASAYPDSYLGAGVERQLLRRAGDILGRREARRLVELGDPSAPVLDVGCGDGTFLRRLAAAGWHGSLHGLEPGRVSAARARSKGIDVDQTTIEHYAPLNSFGLVVVRHAIEHLRDPRFLLERAREVLSTGGLVYVATPDERALAARVFGRYWHGYDPPRHLWVFRPEAVRRLLAEAGFEVVGEQWHLGSEIWAGSLGYVISRRPGRRRLPASILNPLVAIPAIGAGAVELMLRRSTMYAVVGRRR